MYKINLFLKNQKGLNMRISEINGNIISTYSIYNNDNVTKNTNILKTNEAVDKVNIQRAAILKRDFAAEKKKSVEKIEKEIGKSIEEKDTVAVLKYFGLNPKVKEDGKMSISEYKQPTNIVSFSDIGINEDELLKNVDEIKGDANFYESKATNLSSIKRIGGNANFTRSEVKNLENLAEVKGDLKCTDSKVENLNNIEKIGGSAWFDFSEVKEMNNLKEINGNVAYFSNSKVSEMKNLEKINGEAHFYNSAIKDLSSLKEIEGSTDLRNTDIKELPKMEKFGGFVMFDNSKIENIPELKEVKGNVRITNTVLTKEDFENVKVEGKIQDKYNFYRV